MNGIMFQKHTAQSDSVSMASHSTPVSRRQRTLSSHPQVLEPYIQGKRVGIPVSTTSIHPSSEEMADSYRLEEFKYVIVKSASTDLHPGWTGYQKSIYDKDKLVKKSSLHYLKNIEAPPNDMSTVSHVLEQCIKKADDFELQTVVVVFDQALYSKAQQIRWKSDLYQKRLVLRMGEFHTCMAFMGAIGKMCKLSGIEDVLIDAEVVAQGSIAGVLNGHNYNRSIRAHKIMYEGLSRLLLKSFVDSLDDLSSQAYKNVAESLVNGNHRHFCTPQLLEVHELFKNFIATQSAASPMFSYWCTYIQAVLMVLMFVRATRESDWKAHVETFRLMLPFFFSLDRQNYARLVLAKILYAKFAIIYYCDARLPFCSLKNSSPKICSHTLLL